MNRRHFITATAALFCAPAIVRASSFMPVRAEKFQRWTMIMDATPRHVGFIYERATHTAHAHTLEVRRILDEWAAKCWREGNTPAQAGSLLS